MRIALVGTSNSVMIHGFATVLAKHPNVSSFTNFSLGASSSVHSVRSTEGVDFSDFDFCLFEFAVNEDVLVRGNVTTEEQINRIVRALAARCLRSNCLPVILIFPRLAREGTPQVARQIYLDFARSLNLPFFDGYRVIEHIRSSSDIANEELFMDPSHVAPWLSSLFGNLIAEALHELFPLRHLRESLAWQAGWITQLRLEKVEECGENRVFRKNSRYEDTFSILSRTRHLTVDIPNPDTCVIGICVNLKHTSCLLSISGRNQVTIDLRNKYFNDPKQSLVISMLPIRTAIFPLDGKIWLKCLSPGDDISSDLISPKGELGTEANLPESDALEISRLVLESGEKFTIESMPGKTLYREIVEPLPTSVIKSCVDVFRFAEKGTLKSQRELAKIEKRRQKRAEKRDASSNTTQEAPDSSNVADL